MSSTRVPVTTAEWSYIPDTPWDWHRMPISWGGLGGQCRHVCQSHGAFGYGVSESSGGLFGDRFLFVDSAGDCVFLSLNYQLSKS